jgi:hypothetical protein
LLGGVAVVVLFERQVEKLEVGFSADPPPPRRQVLAAQARQVAAVLTGRAAEYQPVVWR